MVLVVPATPWIFLAVLVRVSVRCHEDGIFLGPLLVAESVVGFPRCHVLGGTAHVVHAEHKAVGLVLVVILGHGEVNFMLDAAASEFEVVF